MVYHTWSLSFALGLKGLKEQNLRDVAPLKTVHLSHCLIMYFCRTIFSSFDAVFTKSQKNIIVSSSFVISPLVLQEHFACE